MELEVYWVYVAWIRDLQFPEGDPDAEYPAVLLIAAPTQAEARGWGDQLYAEALAGDDQHHFLRSECDGAEDQERLGTGKWRFAPRCRVGERIPRSYL